jgi:hypothetical protein
VKRVKVVISDLHLGRGRTLEGGATNPLEEFYFGKKLVEFFNYYSSGEFRDVEVEVIINGDFLNFLQTDYRGHFLTVITETVAVEQLKSILNGHRDVFDSITRSLTSSAITTKLCFGQLPDRFSMRLSARM